MAKRIENFSNITGHYDVVLCDVWGVVHNGVDPFPKAAAALEAARASGAAVVLITNSPRLSWQVVEQLRQIGVPDSAYDRIVTSGDVTRRLISEGPKTVFLLGPERDKALLEGIGVERRPAGEAQSLVCTGFFDDETEKPEDYTDMLLDFKARDVPMICANPDLIVERGHHRDLLAADGVYAAMWNRQREVDEAKATLQRATEAEGESVRVTLS